MKLFTVALLLVGSALAQNPTTVTNDGSTTKITLPDTTQVTISCGATSCYVFDTTIEAATSHRQSRRQYFKSIQQYCKDHKGMKWRDCKKAVGPYIDPDL
jgi:hypothetical protein